jgi:predicted nucleotidyltransferase
MDRESYTIVIRKYKKNLKALGISAKKIILYGSHVSGRSREDSDLDLIVVSDDFEEMDLWDRLWILGQARIDIEQPMEILGLTEEEFESEGKGTFIGDEVKSKGIEVT